jgi:hypothetical protein
VSAPDRYPGRGRVLGSDSAVNRSVVEPLVARGVDAQGFTRPDEANDRFDVRDFDLVVFGRGVLGPLSERLKRGFAADNPDVRFIDVIVLSLSSRRPPLWPMTREYPSSCPMLRCSQTMARSE